MRRCRQKTLRHRIFFWFGISIVLSVATSATVVWLVSPSSMGWGRDIKRVEGFVADRFSEVWERPSERGRLARSIAQTFDANVQVQDSAGATLHAFGLRCHGPSWSIPVWTAQGAFLGRVGICREWRGRAHPILVTLLISALVLWAASGFIAHRLTGPLEELVRAARDLGEGKLTSRVRLPHGRTNELHTLALAFNDMASRVEKQVTEQRALLAAVSHEIRTPLAHMRLLIDTAREAPSGERVLGELESEVLAADKLVGQLLASSRLEFGSLDPRRLQGRSIAEEALLRHGVDLGYLRAGEQSLELEGDPTLLACALNNLIDNAQVHGKGIESLRIERKAEHIYFTVEDAGPGFESKDLGKVFDPFYRGSAGMARSGSLGLGLALVKRIALAHGGDAFAENREEAGARVGFSVITHD